MNTKKGEKEVKTLQERYDELRVKYEDAKHRLNRDKDVAVGMARRECESLFLQLKHVEGEMTGR